LHKQDKKYHLYFIGTGTLEEELKRRVDQYGLQQYVHFLGYQKNPYKYLKDMELLLSTLQALATPTDALPTKHELLRRYVGSKE